MLLPFPFALQNRHGFEPAPTPRVIGYCRWHGHWPLFGYCPLLGYFGYWQPLRVHSVSTTQGTDHFGHWHWPRHRNLSRRVDAIRHSFLPPFLWRDRGPTERFALERARTRADFVKGYAASLSFRFTRTRSEENGIQQKKKATYNPHHHYHRPSEVFRVQGKIMRSVLTAASARAPPVASAAASHSFQTASA